MFSGIEMTKSKDTEKTYILRDDGSLSWLLFHTVRILRRHSAPGYSQQRILGMLEDMGPMSQKEVQEILNIQPGSLSELCAKLEDKKLIERKRDEKDRRNVILNITEEGRKKRMEITKQKDDLMFETLQPQEREQLRGILLRLAENASKKDDIDLIEQTEQLKGGHR